MTSQTRNWLEKVQVQAAAVAAFAAAWLLAWPAVRPADPYGPLVFLPAGRPAALAAFAAVIWVLSAAVAAATVSARSEGALLAVTVGAAALAVRSGPAHAMLKGPQDLTATFRLLAGEVAAMAAVLAGAALIVAAVRAAARRLLPGWAWSEPPHAPPAEHRDDPKAPSRAAGPANLLGCLVMVLAVATVLLVVSFRSTDRGQIVFALAGSFFVAALAAHQTFPIRPAWPFGLAPLLMAAVVLGLGGAVAASGSGPAWRQAVLVAHGVPLRAALPVHWLGCGCGGALAGLWVSRRILHARRQEPKTSR